LTTGAALQIILKLFKALELDSCSLLVHCIYCSLLGFVCTSELVKIGSWYDGRQQKQEAMDYRVTKAQEVTEIEKVYLSVQSTFIACLQTLLFVLLWSFSPSKYVHGCLALLSCDNPYEHTAAVPVTMSCLLLDGFCSLTGDWKHLQALATDIHALTKRKDELEAELNEVSTLSLANFMPSTIPFLLALQVLLTFRRFSCFYLFVHAVSHFYATINSWCPSVGQGVVYTLNSKDVTRPTDYHGLDMHSNAVATVQTSQVLYPNGSGLVAL